MLRDEPALVWGGPLPSNICRLGCPNGRSCGSLIYAFLKATERDQLAVLAVLAMYHPPLDSKSAHVQGVASTEAELCAVHQVPTLNQEQCSQLFKISGGSALSSRILQQPAFINLYVDGIMRVVQKLLLIGRMNAHTYIGTAYEGDSTTSRAALFPHGSKIEHSCLPNMSHASKTGQLIYSVIRAVKTGDYVSTSYIGAAECIDLPTADRRAKLQYTYAFHCRCERCVDVDWCRAFWCLDTSCAGVLHERSEYDALVWGCSMCASVVPEREVSHLVDQERNIHFGQDEETPRYWPSTSRNHCHARAAEAGHRVNFSSSSFPAVSDCRYSVNNVCQ